ncbi:hypothetical protein D3C72_2074870 [compost metagenome]
MMTPLPGVTLPDTISAHTTWSAFEYLTEQTDWRIVLIGRAPLKFDVEHDDGFAQALSSGASWKNVCHISFGGRRAQCHR